MKSPKNKGSTFELSIAKRISYWITGNNKKYVLWRTHGSGAVQTITKKVSRLRGDIMNIDPLGETFCNKIYIECKHYKKIDINLLNKNIDIYKWWIKIENICKKDNLIPWLIIKQNYSNTLLCTTPLNIIMQNLNSYFLLKIQPMDEILIIDFNSFLQKVKYSDFMEAIENVNVK